MVRTGTQLYTLRNVEKPFMDVLETVADAGFEGVEFAYRVPDEDPEEVRATLDEAGVAVAGAHVPIDALEDDLKDTVAFYEALGCTEFVVPWLDEEHFTSMANVERAAERLDAIAVDLADSAEHDVRLHYHNHDHEFVGLDDGTAFDALVEATDIGIELDLGLALLGGADPAALLDRIGDRAALVHLKDIDTETGESVPLGEGDLDIEGCVEKFVANGGEWLIYEYEGEDPLDSQPTAAKRMHELD